MSLLPCINRNQSRVLIREARGVNARSLLMFFFTRHHAAHVLNHEYLNCGPNRAYRYRVRKCDEAINNSAPFIVLHFRNVLLNLYNNSDQI